MTNLKQLLQQPLFHFVATGAALFTAWSWIGDRVLLDPSEQIVVSEAHVVQLADIWRQKWQRAPSERELQGLVDAYIREEVYYREALAMGLDEDDVIIRRHLQQKLELLTGGLSQSVTPSEQELQTFLRDNADDYRLEPRATFLQLYISLDQHGDTAHGEAERLLRELQADGDPREQTHRGDPFPLPPGLRDAEERKVASTFGPEFAASVMHLPPGSWQGPIASGYGLHLVYVEARVDGRLPELDEVRPSVARDLLLEKRNQMKENLYQRLRDRYVIRADYPTNFATDSTRPSDEADDG